MRRHIIGRIAIRIRIRTRRCAYEDGEQYDDDDRKAGKYEAEYEEN